MRVLIIIDDLRLAGAQRVIVQDVEALHSEGIDFRVVALAHTPEPSFASVLQGLGIAVEYVAGRGLLDLHRWLELHRLIWHIKPDLVHTHLTYANILGGLAARRLGLPVIATLHNPDVNQLRRAATKRTLEGIILRWCATASVMVSSAACASTIRNFGLKMERTVVIPNATAMTTAQLAPDFDRDRKRRELGTQPDDQLVCTVARLEPSKGQLFLVHALALLNARHLAHPIKLVVIGSGPQERHIRALAASLGVADRVALLGTRNDVSEILAASDLFVLPSLNEGLSLALLEAMALSIPVVATNVGGTSDVLQPGRTGWSVLPGQPAALADAIQRALGAPALARTYARAAHLLVSQAFGLPMRAVKLQALYASVSAGQPQWN